MFEKRTVNLSFYIFLKLLFYSFMKEDISPYNQMGLAQNSIRPKEWDS